MKFRTLPYKQGSRSAKALAERLGGKVLKLEGSSFVPKVGDVIINWGNTTCLNETIGPARVLNPGGAIRKASNKKEFFNAMVSAGLQRLIPPFWTRRSEVPADVYPVVCRTTLAGHSGDGIVIADDPAGLVDAPLYTRYIKKTEEYRIHVGRTREGRITTISVQRKARRTDVPDEKVNWQVRNHCNGFVFVRQGVDPHPSIIQAACDALGCSGLDFGAVDVIWNKNDGKPYVLEINTAPGLEGQTVADYAEFFRSI